MLSLPNLGVIRRIVVALVLSALVGVAAISPSSPAWAVESWTTPVNVSVAPEDAYEPQIVADSNNTLTAVWNWSNGSNELTQTSTSTDAGATWSTPFTLSATGQDADQHQIVAAPNNTLTTIWRRSDGSNLRVQTRTSTDAGANWSSVVDLSATGQNAREPQIVAAPNNTLTAIWRRSDGSDYIVQTRTSTDAGATWSSAVNLSATGQNSYDPQIVADSNNTLTAIWRRSDGSNFIVQTSTSTDAGATWSSVVDLSASGQDARQPQIVAAPNNTLTAIWRRSDGSNFIVQSRTSADAGATWSSVVDLSATGQVARDAQIVAAPNNTLTATWSRSDGSNDIVQTRTSADAGAIWSSVVDLSATGQDAATPQIVADSNNTLTAVWSRSDGSNDIVQTRTSKDAGATWSSVVDLSAAGQDAATPQIVAAPNNTLTAVWSRSDGSWEMIRSSSLGSSSSSNSSSSADPGVPGIFLTVAGPVGRSAAEAPVYYGADRVAVTSTYLLTVTRVSNVTPTITTLAEGTIDADGSFSSMTRLPALAPGTYNVQMVGTHVNGSTLQLTSQVTIGGVGQFTSIGANIPVIK